MIDLKVYYDAVIAAQAEEQKIAHDIDALFRDGTEEAKAQALEKQPDLEKAHRKTVEANALYESMQLASRPNDVAKNFVPVSTNAEPAESNQPTTISRQAYDQMSLNERAKFIRSGGTVSDKL